MVGQQFIQQTPFLARKIAVLGFMPVFGFEACGTFAKV